MKAPEIRYEEPDGEKDFEENPPASPEKTAGKSALSAEKSANTPTEKDQEEIVKEIEALIPQVRASFVIDTLTYLSRGGRCSSVTALLAGTLKLHPEIVVKDGAMGVNKKYRGSLGNAVMKYATDLEEALLDADHDRVFITHTVRDSERAIVDEVRKYLESLGVFKEILETKAGGVISSHCGPGTLGILFIKNN